MGKFIGLRIAISKYYNFFVYLFSAGKVVDYTGSVIKHYPDTPKVLKYLQDKNIGISVASRTGETDGAEQLIQLFGWNKYFQNKQIYPGSKDTHINK